MAKAGFQFVEALPTLGHRADVPGKLQPIREVALHLMALDALFTWVNSPESSVSSDQLNAYLKRSGLRAHLTEDELAILAKSREKAHELHNDSIGWHLENMWALVLILHPLPRLAKFPTRSREQLCLSFCPDWMRRLRTC